MNEENSLESLVISDVLLEHLGLRTASRNVDAQTLEEAGRLIQAARLIQAERFIEAGLIDVIKNIFQSGKFKPNTQNVSKMLEELQILLTSKSSTLTPEEGEYASKLLKYLKNINTNTNKSVQAPFRREMKTNYQSVNDAFEKAKGGDFSDITHSLGNAADNTSDSLKSFQSWGWVNRSLNAKDRSYFKNVMPGVKRLDRQLNPIDVTVEDFFRNPSAITSPNPATSKPGDIIVQDAAQVSQALDDLSTGVGVSSTWAGRAQRLKGLITTVVIGTPIVGGAYGIHAIGKNPTTTGDFDKAFQGDEYLTSQEIPPTTKSDYQNNGSGGYGGTTNGQNFGNLGGQLPNLPTNNKDWLPTNTNSSDYYKIVNNSAEDENIRIAEGEKPPQIVDPLESFKNMPSVNLDEILRSVYTVIDQGSRSEQTLLTVKEFVENEYNKIVPYIKKYEELESKANSRTVVSQVNPEVIMEVAKGAQGVVEQADKVVNQDHRGESQTDSDDFLNSLDIAQKSAFESLAGFGVDIKTAQSWIQILREEAHMASIMEAVKFIQEVARIASSSSVDVRVVFPIAKNILKRQVSSPERAIAILRVIAKYEAMRPGIGLFNLANQAAIGNYNPQELFIIRYSLPSKNGLNSSRDLQQAFDGINMPNTELGKEMYEYNKVHQDFQQTQEMVLMRMQRVFLEVQKNREELLTNVMEHWYESIPGWAKNNPIFRGALQFLSGIAYFSVISKTIKHAAGVGGNGLVNPKGNSSELGFVGASSTRRMKRVVSQTVGATPVDMATTTNTSPTNNVNQTNNPVQLTPEDVANKNIENLNQGKQSYVTDLIVKFGLTGTEIANRLSHLENILPTLQNTLKTNFDNISLMLNAGNQGASQHTKEMGSAAYATSEQIEEYAKGAMRNADDVVGCILELIKIYNQIAQMQVPGNPTGVAQIKAGLRQKEADYRKMLAEAQQMRVSIFDISILGSIDQKVKLLEPRYQELQTNIKMAEAFNGVGADVFVMPFASVAQQMSALYFEAATKYKKASVTMKGEPQMAQYCSQRAQQMQTAGAKARAEGVIALRNLMKQQGGAAVASTNSKFVRLAEETSSDSDKNAKKENPCWDNYEMIGTKDKDGKNVPNCVPENKEVEAKPMKVDEYWDKLYHENPPYGDVMVHPEKHRNKPSWNMKSKHHIKRLK